VMHSFRSIIVIFVLLFIYSASLSTVSAKECESCHGTSGDYTFVQLSISSSTPRIVEPDTAFDHIVVVNHPGEYDATGVTIAIGLAYAPELSSTEIMSKTIPDFDTGTKTVVFKIDAGDSVNPQVITTTLTYTAEYHFEPAKYSATIETSISLGSVFLTPSVWNIDIRNGDKTTLTLTTQEEVQNVQIIPSSGLKGVISVTPENIDSINAGAEIIITIQTTGTGTGKINILFENLDGKPKKIAVDVNVRKKEDEGGIGEFWLPIGAICGVSSWFILLFVTLIGGMGRPVKRFMNKILRTAKIRKLTHCYLSYILLALALFHGVELMATIWNGLLFGWTFIFAAMSTNQGIAINLGAFAWIGMMLLSITGIFQRPLAKKMGYKKWQFTHSTLTKVALILATTHGAWLLIIRFILEGK